MKIKIGDIVRIKSDIDEKIIMTVNGLSRLGALYRNCVWFDGFELKTADFHEDALQIVE